MALPIRRRARSSSSPVANAGGPAHLVRASVGRPARTAAAWPSMSRCFGPLDAPKAFLILSGTHGGEGYTGSAAQIALLAHRRARPPAGDTRVRAAARDQPLRIRAPDPDHREQRRPEPELRRLLGAPAAQRCLPRGARRDLPARVERRRRARRRNTRSMRGSQRHGQQAWMQAIMMGQYDEPTGLNYGGRAPGVVAPDARDRSSRGTCRPCRSSPSSTGTPASASPASRSSSASTRKAVRAGSVPAAGGGASASNRAAAMPAPSDPATAASSSTACSASSHRRK